VFFLLCSTEGLAQGTLISAIDIRDHVYDPQLRRLYITNNTAFVLRYDLDAMAFLDPLQAGTKLNGIDITPDAGALLVADTESGATQGFVRRLELGDGSTSFYTYDLTQAEGGSWDVSVASGSKAFFTTLRSGSGGRVPFREIDLSSGEVTDRVDAPGSGSNGGVVSGTRISRGSKRDLLFIVEPIASKGPIFTYDAVTDTFPSDAWVGGFLFDNLASVNRTSTRIAFEFGNVVSIMDPAFGSIETLGNASGGLVFAPLLDVLYAVDDATDDVVAFDTVTWQESFRMDIGEDVGLSQAFGPGMMSISPNNTFLFLSTPQGIRIFDIPFPGADDCNDNQVSDACDIDCAETDPNTGISCRRHAKCGSENDCNSNGVPDSCEPDCNANGLADECEIADGSSPDCNRNGVPDACEPDCNRNSVADSCDISSGLSEDCGSNGNGIPDECETDCNANGAADSCDIATGMSLDCTTTPNGLPDECEADCDGNSIPDSCELASGSASDCNANDMPDNCEIANGRAADCDDNGIPDACDVVGERSDCNDNGVPDTCDVASGRSLDCNDNGILDECGEDLPDCNLNGAADACEIAEIHDCCDTKHGTGCSNLDIEECVCDVDPYCCNVEWDRICADEVSELGCGKCGVRDCNGNAIPDECEDDCNANGFADECDIANKSSDDCQADGVPDECEPDTDGDDIPDGCDDDLDGDGVLNIIDICPNSSIGEAVTPQGSPIGDADDDCFVTLTDFEVFHACLSLSGPGHEPLLLDCTKIFDHDSDLDVDMGDFGYFQRRFDGR
jgi:hypothetical protein